MRSKRKKALTVNCGAAGVQIAVSAEFTCRHETHVRSFIINRVVSCIDGRLYIRLFSRRIQVVDKYPNIPRYITYAHVEDPEEVQALLALKQRPLV